MKQSSLSTIFLNLFFWSARLLRSSEYLCKMCDETFKVLNTESFPMEQLIYTFDSFRINKVRTTWFHAFSDMKFRIYMNKNKTNLVLFSWFFFVKTISMAIEIFQKSRIQFKMWNSWKLVVISPQTLQQ